MIKGGGTPMTPRTAVQPDPREQRRAEAQRWAREFKDQNRELLELLRRS